MSTKMHALVTGSVLSRRTSFCGEEGGCSLYGSLVQVSYV